MDFKQVKALLRGARLGSAQDSKLSVLAREVDELRILTDADVAAHKRLKDLAGELRRGGTCVHGGDQGPHCKRCMGGLQGPYATSPPGLDYAEFAMQQLGLKSNKLMQIDMELERINTSLQAVDRKIKELEKDALPKYERSKSAAAAQQPTPPKNPTGAVTTTSASAAAVAKPKVVESITDIKKKSGVVLRKDDEEDKKHVHLWATSRLAGGQAVRVPVDLTVQVASLDDVMRNIEARQRECFGRSLRLGKLYSPSNHQEPIADWDELERFYAECELGQGDVFLFDAAEAAVAHDPLAQCYEKACHTLQCEDNAKLKLLLSGDKVLMLANSRHVLHQPVFEAIRFRDSLVELNLNHSEFDLKVECHAISSLVNLRHLSVARTRERRQSTVEDVLPALTAALTAWTKRLRWLESLDLSNWPMIQSPTLPAFTLAFAAFMTSSKRPQLLHLKLNRCFRLPLNSFLGDEDVDNAAQFVDDALVPAAAACASSLEFAHNALFEDSALLAALAESVLASLTLTGCRTWSEYESGNDDDNEEEQGVIRLVWPDLPSAATPVTYGLRELLLGECSLGDEGVARLCAHCCTFPNLLVLNLCSVGCGQAGMDALWDCLLVGRIPKLEVLAVSGNAPNAFHSMPSSKFALGLASVKREVQLQGFTLVDEHLMESSAVAWQLERLTLTRFRREFDYNLLFAQVMPQLRQLTMYSALPWLEEQPFTQKEAIGRITLTRE